MSKGKSIYSFKVNCSPTDVEQIVGEWLNAYQFSEQNKFNENAYYAHDTSYGDRGFQYSINSNVITIYAWVVSVGNKFYKLESGPLGNIAVDNYKGMLDRLFDQINKLSLTACAQSNSQAGAQNAQSTQGMPINNSQTYCNNNASNPQQPYSQVQDISQFTQSINDENNKKKEIMCEIGFWISIIGLILSLFGQAFGVIIYAFDFYFAAVGMKTRKRGKAIATIVLSSVSIVILIIEIIVKAIL